MTEGLSGESSEVDGNTSLNNGTTRPGHSRLARVRVTRLVAAIGTLAVLATLISLLSRIWWGFELAVHFRPQYLAVLFVAAVTSIVSRTPRAGLVFVVAAVVNIVAMASGVRAGDRGGAGSGGDGSGFRMRVLAANVKTENDQYTRLVALVRLWQPDVVVLSEIDERWLDGITELQSEYPHQVARPRSDNFGIVILSREPFQNTKIFTLSEVGVPTIAVQLTFERTQIWILGTHPLPPSSAWAARLRNQQLVNIGEVVARLGEKTIVVGDLNTSAWSPHFQDLVRQNGLRSASGKRPRYTWPVGFPPLMLQLDHCLVASGLSTRGFFVAENIGSDHFPIVCDVALGGA